MAKVKDINSKSKVRVIWRDLWENRTIQKENELIKHYKSKFNVNHVSIDFQPTNTLKLGVVNLETNEVENINAPEIQERLMVDWLKENKIDIEIGDIKRLNKRVESKLNEIDVKDNKWVVKSIEIENFLSYGEKTVFDLDKLKGITIVNGDNFVGKSSFLFALVWGLFGKIDKAETLDEVINMYNGADFATVGVVIIIDGEEIKIERSVTRKKKKTGEYSKTVASLKFMKRGEDGIFYEDDKEEQRSATEKKIKENIGTLNEFLMTIICTGENIYEIVKTKPTERGQILSRFLGLEIFERKLAVVKEQYSEWKIKSSLTKHTTTELEDKKIENNNAIDIYNEVIKEKNVVLNDFFNEKSSLEKDIEILQKTLHNGIDTDIANRNEEFFNNEINTIQSEIIVLKTKINELNEKIKNELDEFDELGFKTISDKIEVEESKIRATRLNIQNTLRTKIKNHEDDVRKLEITNSRLTSEMSVLRNTIKALKEGDKCPECKQKLQDVDHTKVIKERIAEGIAKKTEVEGNEKSIEDIKNLILLVEGDIKVEEDKIPTFEKNIQNLRLESDELNKQLLLIKENDIFILNRDKAEVDIERLELKRSNVETKLAKYKEDKSKIILNIEINGKISEKKILKTKSEENIRYAQRILVENTTNRDNLMTRNEELDKLILSIKKEEHIAKIYEIYMVIVGKNGISKSIMRNSIPLMNLELSKFLRDSAFFTVEVDINEKNNEVEFWKIDNETGIKAKLSSCSGYEKTIASLAIRIVNSKINTLPKPSLLLLDEIFETVSNTNLELMKLFFDKALQSVDNLFIITHKDAVKEWGDNIINVTKENNVTKVKF